MPRRTISTLRLLTTNLGLAAPIATYDVDAQFRDFADAVDQDADRLVVAGKAVEQEIKARRGECNVFETEKGRNFGMFSREIVKGI